MHSARALQLGGAGVLLVDSDPQAAPRTAAVWGSTADPGRGIDRPTIDQI
ncbi:hypothetical protein [Xylophilus rhododendri]|nr:hypothetical protein [Xylophilus rhododendri]